MAGVVRQQACAAGVRRQQPCQQAQQVSPFDVPKYNTPDFIIESATKYARKIDWINFTLGLARDDRDSTLSREDLRNCLINRDALPGGAGYVMGLDIGVTSYCVIAAVTPNQILIIVQILIIIIQIIFISRRSFLRRNSLFNIC